jgi:hypothetical protein
MTMFKSYGLFWRRDEVVWDPGIGKPFRLLGRIGAYTGTIRITDFRKQHGIYILYGNHGSYYVGLAKNLGNRLRDHTYDHHYEQWDRFSWFGFRKVQAATDENGFCKLSPMATVTLTDPTKVISDVEALLIRAMGLRNINQMGFSAADKWTQIQKDQIETYRDRL